MKISEDQLTTWAKSPSETEEEKCQNAVDVITKTIRKKFGDDVSIFLQGSYKNRTNVRKDSDVDIVVRHNDYYFYDIGSLSEEDKRTFEKSTSSATYTFSEFKNDIHKLLETEFEGEVERKNKCIRVKANSYRVNADVVPCYVYKRFLSPTLVEAEGIALLPDNSSRINSFPKQHYNNGVTKNGNTSGLYKSMVRILKNARNNLQDQGIINKDLMPSFLLECLVWNLNDIHFEHSNYRDMTRSVIATIWQEMQEFEKHNNYAEVSDLKWLFRGDNWTPQQAKEFMEYAWAHIGFSE